MTMMARIETSSVVLGHSVLTAVRVWFVLTLGSS
jgi:hypothetical protein